MIQAMTVELPLMVTVGLEFQKGQLISTGTATIINLATLLCASILGAICSCFVALFSQLECPG